MTSDPQPRAGLDHTVQALLAGKGGVSHFKKTIGRSPASLRAAFDQWLDAK